MLLRPEEFGVLKDRTIMKIKPLNTVTLNSLCSCLVSKRIKKKVHPAESRKIMKMIKYVIGPELGERTEQGYEWPL